MIDKTNLRVAALWLACIGLATAAAKRDGSAVFIEFGDGETGKRVLPKRPKVVHKVVAKRDAVEQSVARLLNSKMLGRLFIGNFGHIGCCHVMKKIKHSFKFGYRFSFQRISHQRC